MGSSAAQFAAGSAPLPPLGNLQSAGATGGGDPQQSAMAALVSGLAPIKNAVDSIAAACRQIVQSGAIPGAEQPCSQIVSLAASLLPMAMQQAMQPQPGAPPQSGPPQAMQGVPGGGPPTPGGPQQ